MLRMLMQAVTVIFHPLLISSYATGIIYLTYPSLFSPVLPEFIPFLILAIFSTTAVIPAISVLFLKFTRRISNLEVTKREERLLPFVAICCFYGFTAFLLHARLHVPWPITSLVMLATCLILLLGIMSIRKKVSIHAAAIWGLCGIFTALSLRLALPGQYLLIPLYFIAGLTTSSRIYLSRHSPEEAWIGSAVGYLLSFGWTFFLL